MFHRGDRNDEALGHPGNCSIEHTEGNNETLGEFPFLGFLIVSPLHLGLQGKFFVFYAPSFQAICLAFSYSPFHCLLPHQPLTSHMDRFFDVVIW